MPNRVHDIPTTMSTFRGPALNPVRQGDIPAFSGRVSRAARVINQKRLDVDPGLSDTTGVQGLSKAPLRGERIRLLSRENFAEREESRKNVRKSDALDKVGHRRQIHEATNRLHRDLPRGGIMPTGVTLCHTPLPGAQATTGERRGNVSLASACSMRTRPWLLPTTPFASGSEIKSLPCLPSEGCQLRQRKTTLRAAPAPTLVTGGLEGPWAKHKSPPWRPRPQPAPRPSPSPIDDSGGLCGTSSLLHSRESSPETDTNTPGRGSCHCPGVQPYGVHRPQVSTDLKIGRLLV